MSQSTHEIAQDIAKRFSEISEKAKAIKPELDAERARIVEKSHAERVAELRRNWNAPLRQTSCSPRLEGPWGDCRAKLVSRIGSGFLVALAGNRGAGKTQLSVELMRVVTESGRTALFRSATEIFTLIKASYRPDSRSSEGQVLKDHRAPALLVIDEVTRRGETEWENNILFELLDKRYGDMTDTILTCNLSAEAFAKTFDPALASRMSEGGGIIECNWGSFRDALARLI